MRIFQLLFLLFILVPLLEIYLLIKVGGLIGALPTVFAVVFTAVLGAALLRHQGFTTWRRANEMLARGEVPALELLEGMVMLVSGALLLTPGFFTDTLGFIGLIPPLRRRLLRAAIERSIIRVAGGPAGPGHHDRGPTTLEGDFWRDDDQRRH